MHGAGANGPARMLHRKRQFNGGDAAPRPQDTQSETTPTPTPTPTSTTPPTSSPSAAVTTPTTTSVSAAATTPTTTSAATSSTTSIAALSTSTTPRPSSVSRTVTSSRSLTVPTSARTSPTASASAAAENSAPVGTIIGIIAGGLVGLVVLATIIGYFFRKLTRKKDDWNRSAFVRNSVAINDDAYGEKAPMGTKNALALARANAGIEMEPSTTPRPPTMIERRAQGPSFQPGEVMGGPANTYYNDPQAGYYHNYNGGYANDYAYGQNGQYGDAYGQQQQQSFGYTPPSQYQQSQLTRKPSAPLGNGRGGAGGFEQDGHLASPQDYHSGHQSVTPYQQQQYDEISAQLNAPAGALAVPNDNDGSNLGRSLSTTYSSLNPQQPAKSYTGPEGGNRSGTPTEQNPQQNYYQPTQPTRGPAPAAPAVPGLAPAQQGNNRASYYDDDDAYGGI